MLDVVDGLVDMTLVGSLGVLLACAPMSPLASPRIDDEVGVSSGAPPSSSPLREYRLTDENGNEHE